MMILAYLYKSRPNLKLQYKIVLQSFLNTICLFWCFSPSNSLLLTTKEDMLLLYPEQQGFAGWSALFCVLSCSRQAVTGRSAQSCKIYNHSAARLPRDTGLENYGTEKRCLVQSIVFQVDLMWKENSMKQLCRTWALYVRVHSWSFLWSNKNGFAFVYTSGNWST